MNRIARDGRVTPLSLETYRRMRHVQAVYEREHDTVNDDTFAGFCWGVIACGLVWLILSGIPAELLARLAGYLGGRP